MEKIEALKTILALIGVMACTVILAEIVICVTTWIKDKIKKLEYKRQQKHRFDKPPTAACYCKDCRKWDPETGTCDDVCNLRRMADNWFCCFADPMTLEEKKRRDREVN
jgi:hypothetical protein